MVGLDGVAQANLRPIAEIAAKQRLPSIYPAKDYAMLGGLMVRIERLSYVPSRGSLRRQDLQGAKPAELPVEQPTKWEFVINLKTAKALGIEIPKSVLFRADEVIQ